MLNNCEFGKFFCTSAVKKRYSMPKRRKHGNKPENEKQPRVSEAVISLIRLLD